MGDHHDSLSLRPRKQPGEHVAGGFAIQPFRHLVEKPQRPISEQETGERQPARLAAGKPLARLAKPCLQPGRQRFDVFGKARRLERVP